MMYKGHYVFISYSRRDREFVARLTQDLQTNGVEVWLDTAEIVAGTNWQQEITNGLMRAEVLLYVASQNSVQSAWVERELEEFFAMDKRVIPLVLDDAGAENLPNFLQKFQWVDFRANYDQALQKLLVALPTAMQHEQPIAPKSHQSKGYVFISYAEEDAGFVAKLKGFLKGRGYGYWEYEESNRDYHTQLFLELENVIREAVATLSVLSPAWKRSKWTAREYFFSEESGIPVFLLMVKEMGPTLAVAGSPYIDFTRDTKRGFEKLDKELERKGL